MRVRFVFPALFAFAGCQAAGLDAVASQDPPACVGLVAHETYRCVLEGGAADTSTPGSVETPFVLTRMSLPDAPNRFGISSPGGTSVGVGQRMDDGSWVIGQWAPRDASGPFLTLVTVQADGALLLSLARAEGGHATFGGLCREVANG